jgi:hypothetical protein
LPSLYIHSSCSGMVSNWSKDIPRLSVSIMIPWRSKPYMKSINACEFDTQCSCNQSRQKVHFDKSSKFEHNTESNIFHAQQSAINLHARSISIGLCQIFNYSGRWKYVPR